MNAVLFEIEGHVATITINRPDAKNLLNGEVFIGIADAWDEVRSNGAIRVAVLAAAGTEDFCCGGDLGAVIPLWTGAREPVDEIERRIVEDRDLINRVMLKNEPLDKPIIAAVNGRCLGGGCEILQATDVRIAAESATFGLPEPRSGVVPGAGSMVRLARQLPYAHAMRILMVGDQLDARTALAYGLVSEVVPDDALRDRVDELAAQIASCAPLALAAIKRTVAQSADERWADAFAIEAREAGAVMRSDDAREGPRAFKERRRPHFMGR